MRTLRDFDVRPDRDAVRRLLGYKKPEMNLERYEKILDELEMDWLPDLLQPEGILDYMKKDEFSDIEALRDCEGLAVAIVTIGLDLESEVTRMSKAGEITRALLLDALGSVCTESAADFVDASIRREIAKKGWRASKRFSPGYGVFALENQEFIFDVLPAREIGVRLSDEFMMIPRKSVSFCMNVGQNPVEIRKTRFCRDCDVETCLKRSDEPDAGC
jgi:hypothetical protein